MLIVFSYLSIKFLCKGNAFFSNAEEMKKILSIFNPEAFLSPYPPPPNEGRGETPFYFS